MKIGLYHGYELTGSGSNEYTRYLSRALADRGHEVHVLCREPAPQRIDHISQAWAWAADGTAQELFSRAPETEGACILHQLPQASVQPVFLCDKQRNGNVKAFPDLSKSELDEYHALNVTVVTAILTEHPLDVLHANHAIYQPVVAAQACKATDTAFVVFPHGSSIEYVLREDPRYVELARKALLAADGLITGNAEVRDRILELYPDDAEALREKCSIVGVGVDTELFQPIDRSERSRALQRTAGAAPAHGKPAALTAELRARLSQNEWNAVSDYRRAYDASLPDADIADKLASVRNADHLLLFVGALTAGKGLQSLIAAMPALLEQVPDTRLLIVGSGAYRETLEAMVHAIATRDEALLEALVECGFDLDDNRTYGRWPDVRAYLDTDAGQQALLNQDESFARRVLFLGRLDHGLLRHLFPCADLAVFPSVVPEAYPLVLMESLANGVLPVVTDFSGFSDALSELEPLIGEEWVRRMRLPRAAARVTNIVRSLSSLLGDPELATIGPRLRQIAVERYDWSVRAKQLERAYRTVCARAGA